MTQTVIQTAFAPLKKHLPRWISNPIRNVATAFITPVMYSYRTGHFRSSFKMAAVSRSGEPLPWYTYPSIEFLKYRKYDDSTVLEFGGGQSTLWWAKRAKRVVTLEGSQEWYDRLKKRLPDNVELHYVSMQDKDANINQIKEILASGTDAAFDVIVIDGLHRYEMIDIACAQLADEGIIICDDADGYGIYEGFKNRAMNRVDFYGNAPGVVLPRSTSVYFKMSSFVFKPAIPIHVIAKE